MIDLMIDNLHVRNKFRGVYPSDRLPSCLATGQDHALLVNCANSKSAGTHWVALYRDSFGVLYYFDSFGLPPTVPSIIQFIKTNSSVQKHNRKTLQSVTSKTCGLYCAYFIEKMCGGANMNQISQAFSDVARNDRRIINLYRKRLLANGLSVALL